MMKLNRLYNLEALKEDATSSTPRFEVTFVNEDYVRWVEFFSIVYGKPIPNNCNVARLLMAPSGELIVKDDDLLGPAIRKILINAS
jgi:hypothetical protein